MASSVVVSPPQPKSSSPCGDDDDEEIEYEEIEEEIEVEEEVEEEAEEMVDEDDGDEIGQDLTPVRQENQEHDTSQSMALEEPEEFIQLGPVTEVNSVSNPPIGIPAKQKDDDDLKTPKSTKNEEQQVTREGTSRDTDLTAPIDDRGEMDHARETHCIQGVNTSLATADASCEKDDATISVKAETNHEVLDTTGNIRQMSPRLLTPQRRLKDPSSSAEFDGREIKKLRIVCEFHAKGWCIKGNLCRFLHVKDGSDTAVDRSEALGREASSSTCLPTHQNCENQKLNYKAQMVSHQDGALGNTPLVSGGGSYGHDLYMDNLSYYATPFVKDNLMERYSRNYNNSFGSSAVDSALKEMVGKKNDIVSDDYLSMKSYSRLPISFGSSSWNIDALGTQNYLKNGLDHRASVSSSMQRSMSPGSGSKSGGVSWNHVFWDGEPANYRTTISSYDWEPSVPFRPSHVITRNLLMKENLYDSLSRVIEQRDSRDGLGKFSYPDQGSSVKSEHKQSNCLQEEEMLLKSVQVGNTENDNLWSSGSENKTKFDQPGHKTEPKVDGFGKTDETEGDLGREGHMQNESRALKYFQAVLIEYVKELVKPTWRQGLMSKDAHKLIVKRTVDKVISTLLPHQIPSTSESVKLYLSASESKLTRLVEGYIEKYGKC